MSGAWFNLVVFSPTLVPILPTKYIPVKSTKFNQELVSSKSVGPEVNLKTPSLVLPLTESNANVACLDSSTPVKVNFLLVPICNIVWNTPNTPSATYPLPSPM